MSEAALKAPVAEREMTDGFHLIIDALKLNGVKTIYGVPGIPITDFGRMAQASGIRVLSFRHEQNAGQAERQERGAAHRARVTPRLFGQGGNRVEAEKGCNRDRQPADDRLGQIVDQADPLFGFATIGEDEPCRRTKR